MSLARNSFTVDGDVAILQLGGRSGRIARVDATDLELIGRWRWAPSRCGDGRVYAQARNPFGGWPLVQMHRLILGAPPGLCDHRDGDGLNNCRSNLRLCTPLENKRNRRKVGGSSVFKGVRWRSDKRTWRAEIGDRFLGHFKAEEDAARAYDTAAREIHGAFACVNFPGPGESLALRVLASGAAEAAPGAQGCVALGEGARSPRVARVEGRP